MSVHSLALSLAYLGATLGVTMVVPQILRTLRHPTLTGVSPASWGLTALACATWLTYGIRTAQVPQIPGNVLLVSGAVTIVMLVPSPVSPPRRALALALAAAVLLCVALSLPARSVGYLAIGVGLVSAWPQVYDSVVGWRSGAESGVSIATWSLKVTSQVSWLTYALLAGDVPVAIAASVALTTAVSLVSLEASRRVITTRADAMVLETA